MAGKKATLARVLNMTRLTPIVARLFSGRLFVVNYHMLFNGTLRTEFDAGVYAHSLECFRKQVWWLKERYTILSEDELIHSVQRGARLPRRSCLITFDDGYKDNYELAFPAIKEANVPAIFFIPFDIINERKLGGWDKVSYLLSRTKKKEAVILSEVFDLTSDEHRRAAITRLHKVFGGNRSLPADFLNSLSDQLEVDIPSQKRCSAELMTWDEIRQVAAEGVSIGSHSISHTALSQLSPDEQRSELRQSKYELERTLNRRIRSLAYPFGSLDAINRDTVRLAKEVGYSIAFTFTAGLSALRITEPHMIGRVEPSCQFDLFRAQLEIPQVFF